VGRLRTWGYRRQKHTDEKEHAFHVMILPRGLSVSGGQTRSSGLTPYGCHSCRHEKLAASSMLPLPLLIATCGYGQSGRVRSTRRPVALRCLDPLRGFARLDPLLEGGDRVERVRALARSAVP
jgi:hypothetical protein